MPITYNGRGLYGMFRESFIESIHILGISIASGPVRVPIHLRPAFQKHYCENRLRVNAHPSHGKGSCPIAERRCEYEELQLFDANTMDRTGTNDTTKIIEKLKDHCEVFSRTVPPSLS